MALGILVWKFLKLFLQLEVALGLVQSFWLPVKPGLWGALAAS